MEGTNLVDLLRGWCGPVHHYIMVKVELENGGGVLEDGRQVLREHDHGQQAGKTQRVPDRGC